MTHKERYRVFSSVKELIFLWVDKPLTKKLYSAGQRRQKMFNHFCIEELKVVVLVEHGIE